MPDQIWALHFKHDKNSCGPSANKKNVSTNFECASISTTTDQYFAIKTLPVVPKCVNS